MRKKILFFKSGAIVVVCIQVCICHDQQWRWLIGVCFCEHHDPPTQLDFKSLDTLHFVMELNFQIPTSIVPRLPTEYALYRFCAITHLSWTQVHFLLIIEDRVCYLTLIGKVSVLVSSRLHYCDDCCFASCLIGQTGGKFAAVLLY